jgi:transposase
MTVAEAARVIGEHPQRVWNVLLHHVERAHGRMGLEKVRGVSVDEVRRKRGHNSLTIVSEPMQDGRPTRVLLAVEGAMLVFDSLQVERRVSHALDEVRRHERRAFRAELKKVRWAPLKGDDKLTEADAAVAEKVLKGWCRWVSRSRVPEGVKVWQTIRKRWDRIVA